MSRVKDGVELGWYVAERWEQDAGCGAYGDDAVGTAYHVLYRKKRVPHKFVETVVYVEHQRAMNQPPVSNCPNCGHEEVQESIVAGVFTCDGFYTGCGHTWSDVDAEPPMRYNVAGYSEIFHGKRGQDEDDIRNEGPMEYMREDDRDVRWHHSLESAQESVKRIGERSDDSFAIMF